MSEWQPIETAPRDGRRIWGFVPKKFVKKRGRVILKPSQCEISWQEKDMIDDAAMRRIGDHAMQMIELHGGFWSLGRSMRPSYGGPTHWMPLPDPPKETQ